MLKPKVTMFRYILLFFITLSSFYSQPVPKGLLFQIDFENYAQVKLEKKLREISGLASDKKGRIFAHNDESGTIFQIDPRTGETVKYFKIGRFFTPYDEDFEGIALANDTFYMITGKGVLYEFKEGKHKESVAYKTYDTGLSAKFNFEGLCYDSKEDNLMIIAKDNIEKKYPNKRAIFSFSLKEKKVLKKEILIQRDIVKSFSIENKFSPSGIEYDAEHDHFLIVAARGNVIIEIDRNGAIIEMIHLDKKIHNQPEGVTFLQHDYLLISDEADRFGRVTLYPFRKKRK